MSLLDDMHADRDAVFLDPADFAESITCLLPDMVTTVIITGTWRENDASEQDREHDRISERVAIMRCGTEDLPKESDLWRSRFWRTTAPAEVFTPRASCRLPPNGLARLTLFLIDVEERHARQGLLQMKP